MRISNKIGNRPPTDDKSSKNLMLGLTSFITLPKPTGMVEKIPIHPINTVPLHRF
ncbi:MAG: hypothetical protein HWN79_15350 [Candidatus Lokiarchaeota archaeon]|nr:hypothetical protein [Candidatus Lokiarchaeota archaeon]